MIGHRQSVRRTTNRGWPRSSVESPSLSRTAARAAAVQWALERVADPLTLYLDTETTDLGADAEVIEVAVVAANGDVLFDSLVRPVGAISFGAARVHGIRLQDVAHAPPWSAVVAELFEIVACRPLVVYNAPFDRRLIGQSCGRHGIGVPDAVWHCAMNAFAGFRGEAGSTGYRWHSLAKALDYFGIEAGASHRAVHDARACRAVVLAMAAARED